MLSRQFAACLSTAYRPFNSCHDAYTQRKQNYPIHLTIEQFITSWDCDHDTESQFLRLLAGVRRPVFLIRKVLRGCPKKSVPSHIVIFVPGGRILIDFEIFRPKNYLYPHILSNSSLEPILI